MSTTTTQPNAIAIPKWETVTDELLHTFLNLGVIAANIFVKSPAHRQLAGLLIQGVNEALPLIDSTLGVSTQQTTN